MTTPTIPTPQEPLGAKVLNIIKGLFSAGTVKEVTIGSEINTGAIRGAVTEVTYTIQSAPIGIQADPAATVQIANNQTQAQIEVAKINAEQAVAAARIAAQRSLQGGQK